VKLHWTPEAEQDRDDVLDYIAVDNPGAAVAIDLLFKKAADRAATFPMAARKGEIPGTRELIPHENYRLIYQIREDTVWILALVYTSRQWPPVEPEGDH
jgi:toxin ParE1/3/4